MPITSKALSPRVSGIVKLSTCSWPANKEGRGSPLTYSQLPFGCCNCPHCTRRTFSSQSTISNGSLVFTKSALLEILKARLGKGASTPRMDTGNMPPVLCSNMPKLPENLIKGGNLPVLNNNGNDSEFLSVLPASSCKSSGKCIWKSEFSANGPLNVTYLVSPRSPSSSTLAKTISCSCCFKPILRASSKEIDEEKRKVKSDKGEQGCFIELRVQVNFAVNGERTL